jgi:hypothetical protein
MSPTFSEVARVAPNAISRPPTFSARRVLAAALALVALACAPLARATPTISITSPTTGSTQTLSGTPPSQVITITTAIGSSPAGTQVSSVNFFVNGTSIGTVGGGAFGTYSITWFPTATGTYSLTATVTDTSVVTSGTTPNLNTATSPLVQVTVTGFGPTVTLTNPANAASLGLGASVTLSATAAATGSATVSRVDFLSGTTVLGSAFAAPYTFQWTPSVAGSASLTARVTDSAAFTATSTAAVVNITVPSVTLTSPLNGAGVSLGSTVTLTASASAVSPATVSKVDFLSGTTLLGTATTAPYTINWTPSAAGAVSLTARVTDSNGAPITSTAVAVTVTTSTPTVTLTAPANGATATVGSATTLTATAAGGGSATVNRVDFLSGTTVLGTVNTAPYTFAWTPTAAGGVALTARVTDSNGTAVTSAIVNVTVNAAATPTVSITAPATGAVVAVNAVVTVTATATPGAGATVAQVQFLVGPTVIGTVTTAPYTVAWTPTAAGNFSLTARVLDSANSAVTSTAVVVTAANTTAVSLTAPVTNSLAATGTPVTLTASAIAGTGASITSVAFFADGVAIGSPVTVAPYTVAWTPTAAGTPVLTARATDSLGITITSAGITVTVSDGTIPTVTVTVSPGLAPATTLPVGATRYVLAAVTAAPGRAIVRVEFFVNGAKISEKTSSPYAFKYTAPTATGPQSLSVRATDNAGLYRDALLTLNVVSAVGQPPTCALISPANNITAIPGIPVNLAATSLAVGGTVASVQFYANGAAIGNPVTASPYTGSFTAAAAGSYTIEAFATDDRGNTTVSNAATITAAFSGPTITVTTPTGTLNNPTRLTPGVPATLSANAVVQTGASVTLVEFFVGGTLVGSKTPPATTGTTYSVSWTPTTAQLGAAQSLTARVTDSNSLQTTSNPVYLTVATVVGTPPVIANVGVNPIPAAGLQTASTVSVVATANSPAPGGSIASVEFFINDLTIGRAAQEGTSTLWRLILNFSAFDFSQLTPDPATGRYLLPLYGIARDNSGNLTVSTTVMLAVNPAQSAPPVVSLFTFSATTFVLGNSLSLFPNFSDPDGTVISLQLYANGVVSGGAIANPVLGVTSLTFTPTTAGTFRLFAAVTDDTGNTSFSSPLITVTVSANTAPSTLLTRPADNTTITNTGAPVFLEATATTTNATIIPTLNFTAAASGGAITTLTGTRISTVGTFSTFRAIFTSNVADTFTFGATGIVGNGSGAVTSVSPQTRRVLVNAVSGIAPVVALTNFPGTASSASTVALLVTATSAAGSIDSVEFFFNRQSIGFGERQQLTNLWKINLSFAGLTPGPFEVQAIARDNTGNLSATAISTLTVTNATSSAPVVSITARPSSVAFGQPVTLNANAFSSVGTIASVAYFSNGVSVGTGASAPLWLLNYTPSASGNYAVYAVATDNTGNTAISLPLAVRMKPSNPILDDDAFILQTYQDILFATPSSFRLQTLSAQVSSGALTRAGLVDSLQTDLSFTNVVNVLAAYRVIMGQWPTTANFTTLLAQRNNLANVCNTILNSPEYAVKFGPPPTVTILNASFATTTDFFTRLWQSAGRSGSPSQLDVFRFQNNDTASASLGRGFNTVNLQTTLSEFITLTNSDNTALAYLARTAAIYYEIDKPNIVTTIAAATATPPVVTQDFADTRIAALAALPTIAAIADSVLNDIIYTYRYVTILAQPQSLVVAPRSGALFNVTALGQPPISYQWLFNGAPLTGATSPLLSVTNADTSKAGSYSVVVSTAVGSATSDIAVLSLSTAPTRLGNISSRGVAGSGANVLTAGFVVTGTGTKPMLIRVVGPSLAALGITGFLPNPNLTVLNSAGVVVQTNDDWGVQTGGAAAVTAINQATTRLGAFALPANSLDSVVLATLNSGSYTVQARGAGATTGVAIIEVYDASATLVGAKAVNVSTRANVGTGENILIAGFVVNGTVSRRVLIRGVGPTLRNFGLSANSVLPDPQLKLLDSAGKTIATNDDWAAGDTAPFIAAAATGAGAFPLVNGSKDSSILVMLAPGAYTAQLSGVGTTNNTGIGLIEVYDVDP